MCACPVKGAAGASEAPRNGDAASSELYCSTCNISFANIDSMHSHLRGSKHRVTLLAEQLRSSGSMHANQQGICISELPEGLVVQVRLSNQIDYGGCFFV
jgi:hypothetical protein